MFKHAVLITAATLLVAADSRDDAAKKDLQKLQGSWRLTSGEKDGKKLADEDVKKSHITWKGQSATLETPHQSSKKITATVTLDPTKSPRHMDWTRKAGPNAGKPMHAIYEFTGPDEYRVCFDPSGKERPKEFRTKSGSGHIMHVWKRVKK